jgi:hypothetical protein
MPSQNPFEPSDFREPPEIKQSEDVGLVCFLSIDRPCDGTCMAYLVTPPEGNDYKSKQWASCMLLVGLHRHTKALDQIYRLKKNRLDDESRRNSAPSMTVNPNTGRPL